ncbi:MAG: SprT-like domain-containing protein [Nitrospira sp.]|nr:SprT-like domain-containing protein [Nitrospira sp.]MCW5794179.1 SprT-like domain-containing protein [Nitrospira sp.]HMZ99063.1 SprT-like domain-containing protein [Nitrospira sp.]HND03906.1 SprT-like domain-containing protein [Nitrospira sp.]HNI21051.1 SprT-like domain-containing protein [Nitrospira sp.]
MAPSVEPLLTLWTNLNRRYFQGALPQIPIEWSRRLTSSAGMFVCRVGPRHTHMQSTIDQTRRRCIKLSSVLLPAHNLDLDRETMTTLAHEMIHQWQYDVLKRRPNHGQDFRRMMARMNQDGLGITIYHSLGKAVTALAKYAWRCQQCGSMYRRQRRTIQPRRHLCGACRGPLRECAVVPDEPLAEPIPVGPVGRQFSLPFQSS